MARHGLKKITAASATTLIISPNSVKLEADASARSGLNGKTVEELIELKTINKRNQYEITGFHRVIIYLTDWLTHDFVTKNILFLGRSEVVKTSNIKGIIETVKFWTNNQVTLRLFIEVAVDLSAPKKGATEFELLFVGKFSATNSQPVTADNHVHSEIAKIEEKLPPLLVAKYSCKGRSYSKEQVFALARAKRREKRLPATYKSKSIIFKKYISLWEIVDWFMKRSKIKRRSFEIARKMLLKIVEPIFQTKRRILERIVNQFTNHYMESFGWEKVPA